MTDPASDFLTDGLTTYAPTLKAVLAFEEVVGSMCVDVLRDACTAPPGAGEAQWKAQRVGAQPWVSAWVVIRAGEPPLQLWAGIQWGVNGDLGKPVATVSVYPRAREREQRVATACTEARLLSSGALVRDIDPAGSARSTLAKLVEDFLRVDFVVG